MVKVLDTQAVQVKLQIPRACVNTRYHGGLSVMPALEGRDWGAQEQAG